MAELPKSRYDAIKNYYSEEQIGFTLTASTDNQVLFSHDKEGPRHLEAQVNAAASYDLKIVYIDDDGNDIRVVDLATAVTGWTDVSRDLKYPRFEIRMDENSGADQTVNATINLT